jgi:hypothetical protein
MHTGYIQYLPEDGKNDVDDDDDEDEAIGIVNIVGTLGETKPGKSNEQ